MLRTSWKSLMGRKLRLLMSAFAIVLGVSFVSGSLIFTDMLGSTFNGIMNGTVADVNVQPKGSSAGGATSGSRSVLTRAQIDRIGQVEGVRSSVGAITVTDAYLVGKNGKVLATVGPPSIGGNVITEPAFGGQQGMVVKSGRTPQREGEVAIDPASLEKSGYRLGDTIAIASSGAEPTMRATIVGTVLWGSKGSTAGATYAMFDDRTAQQQWMGGKDAYQAAWVTAEPGQDVDALAERVRALTPAGYETLTGAELAKKSEDQVGQALSFISTFLLVFAGIALVVGSFLIVNTFSILVAQRSRELALLRAMGASRPQVRRAVLFEAFVVGLVGATLGLLLGLGIAQGISAMFSTFGLDMGSTPPRLTLQAVAASYVVGLLVTMLAAYVPARKASSVPPVAAMTGDALTGRSDLGRRLAIGLTLTGLGVAGLLAGLFWEDAPGRTWWIGAGALLTLLGVAFTSPVLGKPVLWGLGRVYRGIFGQVGALAETNATRNPRRTAATASALMIGLTLVTTMAVLGQSAKTSLTGIIEGGLRGDYMYSNPAFQPFSPAIADQAAKVDGVASVHRMRMAFGTLGGEQTILGAMAPSDFDKIFKQEAGRGSLADFRKGTVMVPEKMATDKGWALGQKVDVALPSGSLPLTLAMTYQQDEGMDGGLYTTLDTLADAEVPATDMRVVVDVAGGADKAKVRQQLETIVKDLPMVTVKDNQEFAKTQTGQIDLLLNMIYALLGLAIVIAVLGIVNTLALSVIERTREIGLLRAIGLRRGQLGRMIRLESVAIALLGSVLGLGMGLLFGFALVRALEGDGLSLHVPWVQLLAFLVVAGIVGVLAALWPAHRAARMDVLRAIQTE